MRDYARLERRSCETSSPRVLPLSSLVVVVVLAQTTSVVVVVVLTARTTLCCYLRARVLGGLCSRAPQRVVEADVFGVGAPLELPVRNPCPAWLEALRWQAGSGPRDHVVVQPARGIYVGGRRAPLRAFVDCVHVLVATPQRCTARLDGVDVVRINNGAPFTMLTLRLLASTATRNCLVDSTRDYVFRVGMQGASMCEVRVDVRRADARVTLVCR